MNKFKILISVLMIIILGSSCVKKVSDDLTTLSLSLEYNGQKMGAEAKSFVINEHDSIILDISSIYDSVSLIQLMTPTSIYWRRLDNSGNDKYVLSINTLEHDKGVPAFSGFEKGQYFITLGNQNLEYESPRHILSSFICELIVEPLIEED